VKLIIAEKPSVARDIARVLKVRNRHDGYLSSNTYLVTWAFGHLVGLVPPDAYDESYKKWRIEQLPIIPETFKLELTGDAGAKKQFKIIKSLFTKSTELICATDAGREGELIFRLIYMHGNCKLPAKRLWISSLTDEAILKGFASLKPLSDYDSLFECAYARSKADWLVGFNATRAMTVKLNRGSTCSLGRVQTPTFALVVQRYLEHINFVPKSFWQPELRLRAKDITFLAKYSDGLFDKPAVDKLLKSLADVKELPVTQAELKEKREHPPLLFDLTALQKRCNTLFSYSAQQTLDIAQKLYENKVLSYPRTDSRYLSSDMKADMPSLVTKLLKVPALHTKRIDTAKLSYSARVFDDKKVTDHHAIIPTGQTARLSDAEQNVYTLVALSLVQAFMPVCIKELTSYTFKHNEHLFFSKGTVIKDLGWRELSLFNEKESVADEEQAVLPKLKEGDMTELLEILNPERKTKAPPLLTEASLLALMEKAGQLSKDNEEDDEEIESKFSLGTAATRAGIIELLQKRNYISKKEKSLVPTKDGLVIYDVIKELPLVDIKTTGKWEYALKCIQQKTLSKDRFQAEIEKYTSALITEIKEIKAPTTLNQNTRPSEYGLCPKCKKQDLRDWPKSVSCPDREGCKFIIWKKMANKTLGVTALKALASKKETKELKGFKSKAGKTFNAKLKLDDAFKVRFVFKD